MVIYPAGPFPPVTEPVGSYGEEVPPRTKVIKGKKFRLLMRPGEGINAAPFEAEQLLDLTYPMGGGTGAFYGIIFQLGKWGYETRTVAHSMDVSPVYTEYYQRTMDEKRRLEEQIKSGFASLTNAITDFELLAHDARKYKEYMRYFQAIEQAKTALEKAKTRDDKTAAEKKSKEAGHVLRALFVDYVDAHAGEAISLKGIAPRWPTIISDFMELRDDELTEETIQSRLKIARAEAVVLVTKNKLYNEWKSLFYSTVKGRYERLLGLMKAREQSVAEYRNQLRPLISRYKSIKESREIADLRSAFRSGITFYRPDAQAVALDFHTIWAWRPFVIPEVFKLPRETYDKVTFKEAGFYDLVNITADPEEQEKIKREVKALEKEKKMVPRLPALPIIDEFVLAMIAQIEDEAGVRITPKMIYEEIQDLSKRYQPPYRPAAIKPGISWPFSPYFVFILMDITRTVIRLPNGAMFEDMWFEPIKTFNVTQNVMLGRLLELRANNVTAEREIAMLLGEQIIPEGETSLSEVLKLDEAVKKEFPEVFGEKPEEKKEKMELGKGFRDFKKELIDIKKGIADFFEKLGINVTFAYAGTYEKFMHERMTKMMQLGPGRAFGTVTEYLKKTAGVPGAEPKIWIG